MTTPFASIAFIAQLIASTAGVIPQSMHAAAHDADADVAQPMVQPVVFDATRFDSLTAIGLRAFLDSAAEQGIPTGPLIDKALEGAGRHANRDKILQTVRQLAAALVQAREVLGTTTTRDEILAGASALRAGVDEKALSAIRAARPTGSILQPLVAITDVVLRGVPLQTARDAVATIAKMPNSDEALRGLQSTVAKNSVRGPGMAVDALNRYLRSTVSGNNPLSVPPATDRKPTRPPPP